MFCLFWTLQTLVPPPSFLCCPLLHFYVSRLPSSHKNPDLNVNHSGETNIPCCFANLSKWETDKGRDTEFFIEKKIPVSPIQIPKKTTFVNLIWRLNNKLWEMFVQEWKSHIHKIPENLGNHLGKEKMTQEWTSWKVSGSFCISTQLLCHQQHLWSVKCGAFSSCRPTSVNTRVDGWHHRRSVVAWPAFGAPLLPLLAKPEKRCRKTVMVLLRKRNIPQKKTDCYYKNS